MNQIIFRLFNNFYFRLVFFVIIFISLSFLIPKGFLGEKAADYLNMISILFSLILGFFIAAALANYTKLQEVVAEEKSALLSLFNEAKYVGTQAKKAMSDAIDAYTIQLIDHEFFDYIICSWKEFEEIINVSNKIREKNDTFFQVVSGIKNDFIRAREKIFLHAREVIGSTHWTVLIILAFINIVLLYSVRDVDILSSAVTIAISTTILLLLFLLRDVDSKLFAEKHITFDVNIQIFKEIEKLPYYHEEDLLNGRVKPAEKEYRLRRIKNNEIDVVKNKNISKNS